jgi:hypothetical protein
MITNRKKKFLILSLLVSIISGIAGFSSNKNLAQESSPTDKKKKPMPAGVTCYLMGPVEKTAPDNHEIEESITKLKEYYQHERIPKTVYLSSLKQKLHLANVINSDNPFYKDYFNNLINNEISFFYNEIDKGTYKRKQDLLKAEKAYYEVYGHLEYKDKRIQKLETLKGNNKITQEKYEKKKTKIINDLLKVF